jgi:hypothetical protein
MTITRRGSEGTSASNGAAVDSQHSNRRSEAASAPTSTADFVLQGAVAGEAVVAQAVVAVSARLQIREFDAEATR